MRFLGYPFVSIGTPKSKNIHKNKTEYVTLRYVLLLLLLLLVTKKMRLYISYVFDEVIGINTYGGNGYGGQ